MIKLPDTDGLQEKVRVTERSGPGPRLRAAREASGFEIDDIAKQMRLTPQIIIDLERDTFPEHLALVFVRGYLRAYAQILGLDPNHIVDEFNALGFEEDRELPDLKGKTQSKTRMRSQGEINKPSMSPGLKWAGILALVAAIGGIFVAYNREPEVQLNNIVVPPVSDSTENLMTTPDPSLQTSPVEGEAATGMTTATSPAQTSSPMANTPIVARPAASTAPAQPATPAAAAAPASETNPAPVAPVARPSHDEDDDSPDALNTDEELELPRPERST